MRSTAMVIVGVILIAAGAVILASGGIPYTSRDVILEVGPLNATAETQRTKSVPPVVTGLAIAGGVLLVVMGARKRSFG